MRVVVEGPFSHNERSKIVNEVPHLFNYSSRNAWKRGEVVRGWNLDAWREGELVLVPKLFTVEPNEVDRLPDHFPIGLQVLMDDRGWQKPADIGDLDFSRRWQNDPQESVLVLVAEELELVQGVIKQMVARPSRASLVRLDVLYDVEELGRCAFRDLPLPESKPISLSGTNRKMAAGRLPKTGHAGPKQVVETRPHLIDRITDHETEPYPWELVGAVDVEDYFTRFVVVLSAHDVRIVPLIPPPEDLICFSKMLIRPRQAVINGN